ncbi:hypothetical protein EJ04DRAFT_568086 [Polyplosphaeria fusca]|uniref:DUF6594 domain-containing protein n=1 Tax=Polyplosphaeria fusca TaxID=682080 RepID=A0A9P4QSE5_9PLEO|nr:hypothetical protein EJ04DRAFT_568086 [Polyplosphaeria fusca]
MSDPSPNPPTSRLDPGVGPGRFDFVHFLKANLDHPDFLQHVAKRPEADGRQRFEMLRPVRAYYVEWMIGTIWRQYDEFLLEVKEAMASPDFVNNDEWSGRYKRLVKKMDKYLRWHNRCYTEDMEMAQAPTVPQHCMDNDLRYHLLRPGQGDYHPNGLPRSEYGGHGDRVSESFAAVSEVDDNLLRDFLLKRVIVPLHGQYVGLKKRYCELRGRDAGNCDHEISDLPLDAAAHFLLCLSGAVLLIGSVILLSTLSSKKYKLVAATFLTLAFSLPVSFLGQKAFPAFSLMAAFWAVIVVYIATSSYDGACSSLAIDRYG